MTQNAIHRLCMIDPPALPLSVFGHRPHDLRNASQPECRGACRDKDRTRLLADLMPTVDLTPGPGGTWVLFFVLHSPWCEEVTFGWDLRASQGGAHFEPAKDDYTEQAAVYAHAPQVVISKADLGLLRDHYVEAALDDVLYGEDLSVEQKPPLTPADLYEAVQATDEPVTDSTALHFNLLHSAMPDEAHTCPEYDLTPEQCYRAQRCTACDVRRDEHADQRLPHRYSDLDITGHNFEEMA